MNKLDTLITKYPKLFYDDQGHPSMRQQSFQCQQGWFNIIDVLCARIMHICRMNARDFGLKVPVYPKFICIKQKYGQMSVWVQFYEVGQKAECQIQASIDYAQEMSKVTCQETGDVGQLCVKNGWYATLNPDKLQDGWKVVSKKK